MDAFQLVVYALLISMVLSLLAYLFRLLTFSGALSAFVIGMIIGTLGSLSWLLVLVCFTLVGFLVTRIHIKEKEKKGLQEGRHGERSHTNVLAVGIPPCLVALFAFLLGEQGTVLATIGYISVVSVAASDTVASELGVHYDRVWLITNFKRVAPGTDGGVSIMGTMWAIAGAAAASVLGWVVIYPLDILNPTLIIPIVAGVLGCMLDSVLGATLETNGMISKYTNNATTMLAGGMIGMAMFLLI